MTRRGQVLMIVLWVMGLLTVSIGGLLMRSAHESRLGRIPFDLVAREALLQGAIAHASAVILQDDPAIDHLEEPWATGRLQGASWSEAIELGQGRFSIGQWAPDGSFDAGLIDEMGKLNLRTATPEQVGALLQRLLPAEIDAGALAAAIADWQDGPTGEACQAVVCRNGPLETVDELLAVPGMTLQALELLRPHVTVYGSGAVNVNTASREVLEALGCPGAALIAQRASAPFTEAPPECPESVVQSTVFLVPALADAAPTAKASLRHAVIDREGVIHAWRLP